MPDTKKDVQVFETPFQEFIYVRTYSRWIEEKNRRETWQETVTRYCDYMKKKIGDKMTQREYNEVYTAIINFEVMPSMRALWAAGKAADADNLSIYNCAFISIEKLKDFAEVIYLLMNGCGVGFSVERKFVNKLPVIKEKNGAPLQNIIFEDSKMGWAKGLEDVLNCLWEGQEFECDYSKIRPRGARLKTFGGRASGPDPLIDLINFTIEIVERNRGFQIRPIDVHDIICKTSEVIVVGGSRRAACISLSDLTDNEMANAKMGEFWHVNPQRALSNNSVAYTRKPDIISFIDEWKNLYRSKSGERGIFSRVAAQKKANENDRRDGSKVVGINPSLRRGTPILTTDGLINIEELEGKEFKVRNLTGKICNAKCWLSGKNKKLYKIKLVGGHEYFCTAEHKWPIYNDGNYIKKETTEIIDGEWLAILRNNELPFGFLGNYLDGFFIGWIYGDGSIGSRSTGERIISLCVSSEAFSMGIGDLLINKLHDITGTNQQWVDRTKTRSTYEMTITNNRLLAFLDKFNVNRKEYGLPISLFRNASEDFRKGFIDGLLSSDGSIERSSENSYRLSLVTSKGKIAKDFSILLGLYGIKNTVNYRKVESSFPNKKNYNKLYDNYNVRVSDIHSIQHLANLITLKNTKINNMLKDALGAAAKFKIQEHNVKILSVDETTLYEDVWDIFVDDETHCFQLTQCITGNCGEVLLFSKSACNLSEVVVRPEDDFNTLKKKVKTATLLGTWQSTLTKFKFVDKEWKSNMEEERLLGVSLTGLRDHPILGTVNDTAKKWLGDLKHIAIAANKKISTKIGINQSAAISVVKPSGTVSLLVNSSPGMHVRPTDTGYYIRRVRISATDPLCQMLREQGVPIKNEVGHSPESCSIFVLEFPCKAPKGAKLRGESAREQLEYWRMLRNFWTEHNPSCTIYVKEDEWLDTAAWVYRNFEDIGGLSFLPASDHVYQLAPFEDIDKETYEKMVKEFPKIDFSKLIEYEEDDQTTGAKELACVGDSCEI